MPGQAVSNTHTGLCPQCRYSLVGLPVRAGAVVCPECGRRSSLADLAHRAGTPLHWKLLVGFWPALVTVAAGLGSLPFEMMPYRYISMLQDVAERIGEMLAADWLTYLSPVQTTAWAFTGVAVLWINYRAGRCLHWSWWCVLGIALPVNLFSTFIIFVILFIISSDQFLV